MLAAAQFGRCFLRYWLCLYRFVYSCLCFVFIFSFGAVLNLFLTRLPLGDSYKSVVCDFSACPVVGVVTLEVGRVITLEYGGSIPGILARVVRWCTCGAVLIIDGAMSCVDVWCVRLFIICMSPVFC